MEAERTEEVLSRGLKREVWLKQNELVGEKESRKVEQS